MRILYLLGLLMLILAACAPSVSEPVASDGTPAAADSTPLEGALLPEEPPPPGAEAEFSTDFSRHSVPYSEIISGGPPKDTIPAIDSPQFISVEEADQWLDPHEAVILVEVGGSARAYPVQILMWHEIVNDIVAGVPLVVTYCPLCNTGVAFERTLDGQVFDFGTTGRLRYSNLIMYDRQTETWWQQATGEGVVGEFALRQLTFVPASMISWGDFQATYPDGQVLSRETGYSREYGRNPYTSYDDINRSPFLFQGPDTPDVLPPMARVLTVDLNGEAVAYPYEVLQEVRVINDSVGSAPIVVLWAPGTASALDAGSVAGGDDVGAGTTYSRELDAEMLTFVLDGDRVLDEQSGSEWNILGQAVSGPKAGSQLEPVVSVNHFWFSWAAFRPDTRIYTGEEPTAATPSLVAEGSSTELLPDFEIDVYQGEDVLGGQSVGFSEVLAQGRPIVLNFWAGLCPICRAEMPSLEEAHNQYSDRVLILGVDIGPFVLLGDKEDGLSLLDELDITYPAGSTSDSNVIGDYKVLGTPTTLFITPDGEVVRRRHGIFTEGQLSEFIEALLEASYSS